MKISKKLIAAIRAEWESSTPVKGGVLKWDKVIGAKYGISAASMSKIRSDNDMVLFTIDRKLGIKPNPRPNVVRSIVEEAAIKLNEALALHPGYEVFVEGNQIALYKNERVKVTL